MPPCAPEEFMNQWEFSEPLASSLLTNQPVSGLRPCEEGVRVHQRVSFAPIRAILLGKARPGPDKRVTSATESVKARGVPPEST